MIRGFLTLLAGALWLAGCSAPDPLTDREWPAASPALWEVTSPDGERGWLFGTVHALPDGLDWHSEAVEQALSQSAVLVVEIAGLDDGSRAASEFSSRSSSPGLPPLSERVPPQDRAALHKLLDLANADEGDFATTESWAAALILSGALRSGDPANGVDRDLEKRGMPAIGLEGYAAQYALFDALPESEQSELLSAVAREAVHHDPVASLEAWLTGDMKKLEKIANEGMLGDPELREALLNQRNRNWLPEIREQIDSGAQPFIAVGAAHMLGASGLPALLEEAGYSVSRIQ